MRLLLLGKIIVSFAGESLLSPLSYCEDAAAAVFAYLGSGERVFNLDREARSAGAGLEHSRISYRVQSQGTESRQLQRMRDQAVWALSKG